MRMQLRLGSVACAVLASLALCGSVQAGTTISIGGTGAGLAAMKMLANAYGKTHPGITIKVMSSLGSGGGITALIQGALDLAISARPLKESELRTGAQFAEYARTPFVFAVHRKVPKTDLTTEELLKIYLGKTVAWDDGSRIRLILRPFGDTDTDIVRSISPELDQAVQKAHARRGMTVAVTDQECADAITREPGALGGSTLSEILTENRPVNMLSFNGVKPTLTNLSKGSYPLVKRLYLVNSTRTTEAARQFARFIRSPQGRAILEAAGNLPPSDGRER
jgi:phosphate transport system substrate-binding protein